jgi:hypothetical protein
MDLVALIGYTSRAFIKIDPNFKGLLLREPALITEYRIYKRVSQSFEWDASGTLIFPGGRRNGQQ